MAVATVNSTRVVPSSPAPGPEGRCASGLRVEAALRPRERRSLSVLQDSIHPYLRLHGQITLPVPSGNLTKKRLAGGTRPTALPSAGRAPLSAPFAPSRYVAQRGRAMSHNGRRLEPHKLQYGVVRRSPRQTGGQTDLYFVRRKHAIAVLIQTDRHGDRSQAGVPIVHHSAQVPVANRL
jgi:hypothetical protein